MPDAASLPRLALHRCAARRLCGAAAWNGRTAGRSCAVREPIMLMIALTDHKASGIRTDDPERAILSDLEHHLEHLTCEASFPHLLISEADLEGMHCNIQRCGRGSCSQHASGMVRQQRW